MTNKEMTLLYVKALTGSVDTVLDWRVVYDREKGVSGINLTGSVEEVYQKLLEYNQKFYGVFINVNAMKPNCRKTLENIDYIRTHLVDIDDVLSSQDSYNRAVNSDLPPHFAVQTSPGKFHLYWLVEPYRGIEFFTNQQRKLSNLYNGDESVTDATRILRVPGFYHCKGEPHLVTCWGVSNNPRYTSEQISNFLSNVEVLETSKTRKPLGDDSLTAPSLEWLEFALNLVNPNELSYTDWMALGAAFKQAGWSLTTEDVLYSKWLKWCQQYNGNNERENLSVWKSFKDTQVGWARFQRITNVNAYYNNNPEAPGVRIQPVNVEENVSTPVIPTTPSTSENKEDEVYDTILDEYGKKKYFKNCFFIGREGRIFSPNGRFLNQTQFNGLYGGKEFCLKPAGGSITDDAWKAALRSTDWTIPKLDHVRFLPQEKSYEIVVDEMGRKGLNSYIPARIKTIEGDVSLWKDFLFKIFNTSEDVKIFESYIAHCIKFPGWKIPWSVLLQSAKGIGKQMIGEVLKHCIGESYTYQPKAEELVTGASHFNGWMRNKILILVDEVRVGDRYDLMNGLKTIITDKRIAIESKGVDQEMEDNVSNWVFFSNYKDAFPIDENERRYCIFYSCLQSAKQILEAGMTKQFFDRMYYWLEQEDGFEKIAYYYLHYPIAKGSLSHRAPETSSYQEVLRINRSPIRVILDDLIEQGVRGFRNGYVSFTAFQKAIADSSLRSKPADHIIKSIVEAKGYVELGFTNKPVIGEDLNRPSLIFGLGDKNVEDYEKMQN